MMHMIETKPTPTVVDLDTHVEYEASPQALPALAAQVLTSLALRLPGLRPVADSVLVLLRERLRTTRIAGLQAMADADERTCVLFAAHWTTRRAALEVTVLAPCDFARDKVVRAWTQLADNAWWYAEPAWEAYRELDEEAYLRACEWSVGRARHLLRERGYEEPAPRPAHEPDPYTPARLVCGPAAAVLEYNLVRAVCARRP